MRLTQFVIEIHALPQSTSVAIYRRCIHIANALQYQFINQYDIVSPFGKLILSLHTESSKERAVFPADDYIVTVLLSINKQLFEEDYDTFFNALVSNLQRMQDVLYEDLNWKSDDFAKAIQHVVNDKNNYTYPINTLSLADKRSNKRVDVMLKIEEESLSLIGEVFDGNGNKLTTHTLIQESQAYLMNDYLNEIKSEFRDSRFVLFYIIDKEPIAEIDIATI